MAAEGKKLQFSKIAVQWNAFVKIKKKNYLEDYIFIKEIGKGAYGYVSKIKMKYGGLLRAAKVIKSESIAKEKNKKEKLFAEISIPIKLDHPNIAKLYEVFEWKNQFVLIMELMEGGDLFHFIKQNKLFSEKKAAELMKQIMSAVFYMHKQNVCHRDLKPENMLYDTESKALKIIDFGTASVF
jgi:calcium-dependent protein kinase